MCFWNVSYKSVILLDTDIAMQYENWSIKKRNIRATNWDRFIIYHKKKKKVKKG